MSSTAQIRLREPGLVAASWRDLLIFHWQGAATLDAVRSAYALQAEIAGPRIDQPFAVLTVVTGSEIALPDAEMRRTIDASRRFDAIKRAEATVIESTGFFSAVIRGMIATAMLARRSSFPTRVAASVREACDWLAPRLDGADADALFRVVEGVVAKTPPS